MAVKRTEGAKKLPTLSTSRPSKIFPKLGFWFENKPSGNPGLKSWITFHFKRRKEKKMKLKIKTNNCMGPML
jgi:hypothetical protein